MARVVGGALAAGASLAGAGIAGSATAVVGANDGAESARFAPLERGLCLPLWAGMLSEKPGVELLCLATVGTLVVGTGCEGAPRVPVGGGVGVAIRNCSGGLCVVGAGAVSGSSGASLWPVWPQGASGSMAFGCVIGAGNPGGKAD